VFQHFLFQSNSFIFNLYTLFPYHYYYHYYYHHKTGYASDVTEIMKYLPKICQGFLMSATLSPELNSLKKVVLHSPAVLKLEEAENDGEGDGTDENGKKDKTGNLTQLYLTLSKKDKNLVLYVFLKLGLLKGKGLFFVNTTDGGYRLKLFLEQFHIRSAVLNAELPLRSRLNIIEQFNVGNFDYLIATDESTDANGHKKNDNDDDGDNEGKKSKKKSSKRKKDSEYGVSRGLDFRGVSFVVNVDFPLSPESYTHRIGRTARGGAKGVALSLVEIDSMAQLDMLAQVQESQPALPAAAATANDDNLHSSAPVEDDTGGDNPYPNTTPQPTPLDFDLNEIEGFRYRVEDVSRAVTKTAVKETRAAELRAEILNSERLQNHFAENPSELQLLRHDRQATHISKVQEHLK
jgi:ATP-dependent RNA helicase DDX56/DBP9